MTEQHHHLVSRKDLFLLWFGGFLVGLAIAVFRLDGAGSGVMLGGAGAVLSGLALRAIIAER